MFDKLKQSIGERVQIKDFLYKWDPKNRGQWDYRLQMEFSRDSRSLSLPVLNAVADAMLTEPRLGQGYWQLHVFPWGTKGLEPSIVGRYLDYVFERDGADVWVHWLKEIARGLGDDFRPVALHALRFLTDRGGAEASRSGLNFLKRALGEGARTVLEPWQEVFFDDPNLQELVDHALKFNGTTIKPKWLKTAKEIAEKTDPNLYAERIERMLDIVAKQDAPVSSDVSEQARGFVVFLGLMPGPKTVRTLSRALRVFAEKIPDLGARCGKGFSGAVLALQEVGTFDAIAALSVARGKIKASQLVTQLNTALYLAAQKQKLSVTELEERVVPDFDLEANGVLTVPMKDERAELSLDSRSRVVLRWFGATKELASPSAAMKAEFAEELSDLRRAKKEIEAALTAQKRRLDHQMLSKRRIPYAQWRECYLDHPLMGSLARRLIWEIREPVSEDLVAVLPTPEGLMQASGERFQPSEQATVKLWHPVHATDAEAAAWRDVIVEREVVQPFKQAFREVYVLTPAEEATDTYSNRFAAQIIRQHQAVMLMRDRDWMAQFQGFFDNGFSYPVRYLSEWDLRVHFHVEVAGEDRSEAGIALFLSTDQFRFGGRGDTIRLIDVPAIVFSEICRDIDLFVGVASIGNDPEWTDRGDQRPTFGAQAWRDASFGELSQNANTRKQVLERLLPRLKIAACSRIEGNYLIVAGWRHEYAIHLGSGNILIRPENKYLCIVPAGKNDPTEGIYLPFEGDRTLAVILSKAMLLMNDRDIADKTILRQI